MLRVGLTGGIASGKSTVASLFAGLGVDVIDTDEIAREVVEPGQPALAEIRSEFGEAVIRDDGTLDRRALRRLVFDEPARRQRLEAILHPRIRAETLRQSQAARGPYHIIVVPLLFETGFDELVERVIVVDIAEDEQRRRLIERDGETAEQAQRMIESQLSRAQRLSGASDIIDNSKSLAETQAQVEALHHGYVERVTKSADS